jgi:hypothetical protein
MSAPRAPRKKPLVGKIGGRGFQDLPHERIDAPWHVLHTFLPPNRFELNRLKAITLSSNSTPQTSQPGFAGIFWHFWHNFFPPNLFEFRRQKFTTFGSRMAAQLSHFTAAGSGGAKRVSSFGSAAGIPNFAAKLNVAGLCAARIASASRSTVSGDTSLDMDANTSKTPCLSHHCSNRFSNMSIFTTRSPSAPVRRI